MNSCDIEGCPGPRNRGGGRFCSKHYTRIRRYGDAAQERAKPREKDLPCTVDGCARPRAGKGLCRTHWQQNKRRGDPCAPPIRGALWTPEEDRKLLDLPRYPRSGMVRRGEMEALALHLGRSLAACRSRLHLIRARGHV